MKIVEFIFILLTPSLLFSQIEQENHSAWNTIIPSIKINEKWSALNEFHRRSTSFYNDIDHWVIRPRIDYKTGKKTSLGMGMSYLNFQNSAPQPDLNEYNIYQNFKWFIPTKHINFTNQFRVEERFIENANLSDEDLPIIDTEFSIRTRYRLTVNVPIKEFSDHSKLSIQAYDEIFFTNEEKLFPDQFGQNWILIAPKWQINNHITLLSGYHYIYADRDFTSVKNYIWDTTLSLKIK